METLDAEAAAAFAKEVNVGQNIDIASDGDVYNILLIGSDTRNGWYGNSDSMILASINSQTKTIYMTSFMRDLYANIPNVGIRKLNSAYAVGGGPLLVSTIESNYRIDIDNYASVDFSSMANIIDLVGGVDLEVSTQEAGYINMYLDEQCGLQGLCYRWRNYTFEWKSGSWICKNPLYKPWKRAFRLWPYFKTERDSCTADAKSKISGCNNFARCCK